MRSICYAAILLTGGVLFSVSKASAGGSGQEPEAGSCSPFTTEKIDIPGGLELVTFFARVEPLGEDSQQNAIPLLTILRDTLGDEDPTNDRLRYVWMLTFTNPTMRQKVAAAIPFFYNRFGNKKRSGERLPPHLVDLATRGRGILNRLSWAILQQRLFDTEDLLVSGSTRTYRRNRENYYQTQVARALGILDSSANSPNPTPYFRSDELQQIQARLMLQETTLGKLAGRETLDKLYQRRTLIQSEQRSQNWELLRQRAEDEGLYFQPLGLPGDAPTHALLWVARSDVRTVAKPRFNSRFLNISSPWNDNTLIRWEGYSEVRHLDSEQRPTAPDAADTREVELIPLAIYGLDHPKIPALLIDFRKSLNAKGRELSRYALDDVSRHLLALSPFSDLGFLTARSALHFVTSKRGTDLQQPSRMRSYSQLKLFLALDRKLPDGFRADISRRLERVSTNSLENDLTAEAMLARQQYRSLLTYALQPSGLLAQVDKDRKKELMSWEQPAWKRLFLKIPTVLASNLHRKQEGSTPDLLARLSLHRRLELHTRLLQDAVDSGPQVEVVYDSQQIANSLRFLKENSGRMVTKKMVELTVRLFQGTQSDPLRELCLASLRQFGTQDARNGLVLLARSEDLQPYWRSLAGQYLDDKDKETETTAVPEFKTPTASSGG